MAGQAAASRKGKPGRQVSAVTPELVLDTAARLIELHGVDALTMRGLAEQLGVAVTSIYWHVGGRDDLLDKLIDRLIADMARLPVEGKTPAERIAWLARAQRTMLAEHQQLLGAVHERDRTPTLFLPWQQTIAAELAELGVHGSHAAVFIRALGVHVVSSVLMERAAVRNASHETNDPSLWAANWPDRELITELTSPPDYLDIFEYGLDALLAPLNRA